MFKITSEDKKARAGVIKTPHGSFKTPYFIPVATSASVRSLDQKDMKDLKAEVLLANTFHLHLRPGDDLIKKQCGLHNFMNWEKPIVTDSGGFQAFSLGYGMEHGVGKILDFFSDEKPQNNNKLATINDQGVTFNSPIDGKKIVLTPKTSMQIQNNLGADIIFAFDECTSPLSDKKYTKIALERTHRWAKESLKHHKNKKQALFGIVQGGAYKDLRVNSARYINSLDFPGFGIGGSLGKSKDDMKNILNWTLPLLDKNKPRHLLGIGAIEDIFNSVEKGIDTFDCVAPTRWGRRGHLYISPDEKGNRKNKFRMHIKNSRFKEDKKPIDKACNCYVCKNYSRSYLRHLYTAKELTYFRLASYHNMHFLLRLMEKIRTSIKENSFKKLKRGWLV